MTAQTRTTLKGVFEQGDQPQGTDFEDLIDSFLVLSGTESQTVAASSVFFDTLRPSYVVAGGVRTSGAVSANSAALESATITALTIQSAHAVNITMSSFSFFGPFNAGTVSANSVFVSALSISALTTVAASGGGGGAIPTSAEGFVEVTIGGVVRLIPFFEKT